MPWHDDMQALSAAIAQHRIPGANDPAIDRLRKERDMNELMRRFEGQGPAFRREDPARRPQRTPGQVGINPAPQVYLPEVMEPEGGVPWPNADFAPPPSLHDDVSRGTPRFPRRPFMHTPPK